MLAGNADLWLPVRGASGWQTGRLVILPHAGSGTGPWFRWSRAVPDWVEVRVARLPGRECRMDEPALTSMEPAVDALAEALRALPPLPTVLLGHSLGARLAHSLCRRVPDRITALMVSGEPAPEQRSFPRDVSGLPDPELAQAAHAMWNAIPAEILESVELQALFLPALRADLALARSWVDLPGPKLRHRVVAVAGDDDPEAPDLPAWAAATEAPTTILRHAGGHMAILHDEAVGSRVIAASLELLLA